MSMIHLRFFRNSKVEGRIPVNGSEQKQQMPYQQHMSSGPKSFCQTQLTFQYVCMALASAKQMPFSLKLLIQNIQSREEAKDLRVQLRTVSENRVMYRRVASYYSKQIYLLEIFEIFKASCLKEDMVLTIPSIQFIDSN